MLARATSPSAQSPCSNFEQTVRDLLARYPKLARAEVVQIMEHGTSLEAAEAELARLSSNKN